MNRRRRIIMKFDPDQKNFKADTQKKIKKLFKRDTISGVFIIFNPDNDDCLYVAKGSTVIDRLCQFNHAANGNDPSHKLKKFFGKYRGMKLYVEIYKIEDEKLQFKKRREFRKKYRPLFPFF